MQAAAGESMDGDADEGSKGGATASTNGGGFAAAAVNGQVSEAEVVSGDEPEAVGDKAGAPRGEAVGDKAEAPLGEAVGVKSVAPRGEAVGDKAEAPRGVVFGDSLKASPAVWIDGKHVKQERSGSLALTMDSTVKQYSQSAIIHNVNMQDKAEGPCGEFIGDKIKALLGDPLKASPDVLVGGKHWQSAVTSNVYVQDREDVDKKFLRETLSDTSEQSIDDLYEDDAYDFALADSDHKDKENVDEKFLKETSSETSELSIDDLYEYDAYDFALADSDHKEHIQVSKKGKEKVQEVDSKKKPFEQLRCFAKDFTSKSVRLEKVIQDSSEGNVKTCKLRSVIDDAQSLLTQAMAEGHISCFAGHEVDAGTSLSHSRQAYFARRRVKGIEPIVCRGGVVMVPTQAITGNADVDQLNFILADAYSTISCLLQQRLRLAEFAEAHGEESSEVDISFKKSVHQYRTACRKIRLDIMELGYKALSEPLVYWKALCLEMKF